MKTVVSTAPLHLMVSELERQCDNLTSGWLVKAQAEELKVAGKEREVEIGNEGGKCNTQSFEWVLNERTIQGSDKRSSSGSSV